jgi:hypothetical protein
MPKNFSQKLQKQMISDVKAQVAGRKSSVKTTDMLIADGFKYTDFISPGTANKPNKKSTATKESHDRVTEIIKLGFTESVQNTLRTPTNALTEHGKANKRYWIQQIGTQRAAWKRALQKRVTSPNTTRPLEERVNDSLDALITLCENAEKAKFDLVKMLEALKTAKGISK